MKFLQFFIRYFTDLDIRVFLLAFTSTGISIVFSYFVDDPLPVQPVQKMLQQSSKLMVMKPSFLYGY